VTEQGRPTDVRGGVDGDGDADVSTFLLPTGTVTFLLTDVEHSTLGWETAPEAMAKAISRHYEILADVVGRHRGVRPVEQGEGDSIVAAFSRGVDAVAAALEAQQRLASEPWPDEAAVSVRMALHTGDAQLRDAFNYFGQTVIRAARLRALAHGGQVLVSRATHDLVADPLPGAATWRDLGVHRLKDLGRPEHVYQLCHPDLRDDFPSLRGLDALPNNLPAQLTSFIGRRRELRDAAELMDAQRLVTITGSGGCGKTRLGLQLAAERFDRYPEGVWYVELASLAGSGTVARQVADVLGVQDEPDRALTDTLADHIGPRTMLFVLDNCEHLLDECAVLVDALTRRCEGLHVLATSRQVLDVPGEFVWRVPSMAIPPERELPPIDALTEFDAVRLFCDRATRGRSEFTLSPDNAPAIVTICRRLDGIPLALELAAARVRSMGIEEILRGLDDRFRLLAGGARTLLPRQQTLAASVDWSYDLLEPGEQQTFNRLSVFAGAFTLESARAVADDADVLDRLIGLVDRSLVQFDDAVEPARYRYLETVKAYGRSRVAQSGDEVATRDRHLAYYAAFALEAERGVVASKQSEWLARVDRELDDLRAALEWASAGLSLETLLRMTAALGPYWHARGHSREAQSWYERALTEAPDGPAELRARVLWASAYQALYADEMALSYERGEAALVLARECGDDRTIARALDTLATLRQFADPAGTQPDFLEAARLAEQAGDLWCRTDALQKAAFSDFYRDRWPEALALEADAYELALELGNQFFVSWHYTLVGTAAWRQGRLDEARSLLQLAFDDAIAVGEPLTIAAPGSLRGAVELVAGDSTAAVAAADEFARALGDRAHDGFGAVMLGYLHGLIALCARDNVAAIETLQPIVEFMLANDVLYPTSMMLQGLAAAQLATGDLDVAKRTNGTARDVGTRLQSDLAVAVADLLDAAIARAEGRPDLADPLARASMTACLAAGAPRDAVDALEVLGGCLLDLGNASDALRLLASASATRAARGWSTLFPQIPELAARDAHTARAAVGEQAPALEDEGRRLALDDAVAYAMRARGTRKRPAAGWASLTPTELQVVQLVAEGRTNPEIAAALFVSRATAKTHVSHVLGKLGLASRAELAAEAARHDR
jgi:predicted ATPase/class 3 adenylate cyclase/DNA-binding CsgD family transcriptional regulator